MNTTTESYRLILSFLTTLLSFCIRKIPQGILYEITERETAVHIGCCRPVSSAAGWTGNTTMSQPGDLCSPWQQSEQRWFAIWVRQSRKRHQRRWTEWSDELLIQYIRWTDTHSNHSHRPGNSFGSADCCYIYNCVLSQEEQNGFLRYGLWYSRQDRGLSLTFLYIIYYQMTVNV